MIGLTKSISIIWIQSFCTDFRSTGSGHSDWSRFTWPITGRKKTTLFSCTYKWGARSCVIDTTSPISDTFLGFFIGGPRNEDITICIRSSWGIVMTLFIDTRWSRTSCRSIPTKFSSIQAFKIWATSLITLISWTLWGTLYTSNSFRDTFLWKLCARRIVSWSFIIRTF